MDWNLPNKITVIRILLIPVFLIVLLGGFMELQLSRYIAVSIFVIASLTDFLDGYLARKLKLISNFGIFMDPIADKLLVCAALIAMVELGDIPSWIVILIVSREFIISGFKLLASDQGIVLAASKWAKVKTASQMMMIIYVLLNFNTLLSSGNDVFNMIGWFLIYLAATLTVVSAVEYIVKNFDVLRGKPATKKKQTEK